jgi:hypothetical protein
MIEKIKRIFVIDGYGNDEDVDIETESGKFYQISICHSADVPERELEVFNGISSGKIKEFDYDELWNFDVVEFGPISKEQFLADEKEYGDDEDEDDEDDE